MGMAVAYLTLYNSVLCVGWTYVLYLTIETVLSGAGPSAVYPRTVDVLQPVQTAAIMEVLHCMVGIVRSGVVTTAVQVASRLGILWGVLYTTPEVQGNPAIVSLLAAWALTEPIRYSFYTFQLLKLPVPAPLLWIRYSLFIIAYPVGITSEVVLAVSALPHIRAAVAATGMLSVSLPNAWNFGFDFYWAAVVATMLIGRATYLGASRIHQQTHMLKQRKSKLSKVKTA